MTKHLSLFGQYCERWKEGCGNTICETSHRVVLCRGTIPCDILFIGEAPGESEDTIGKPFIGPAGKLLDQIIQEAMKTTIDRGFTHAFTNLVGCIPRDDDGGKATEPTPVEIIQCSRRLEEFVELCNPKLIVCVGKLSENWIQPTTMGVKTKKHIIRSYSGKTVALTHPAAILRANIAQKGLMIQRNIVNLQTAIEELE